MPQVTYVQPDGSRRTCVLDAGESVMDGALDHAIPGITAQCGGGCTCATCHCYVLAPDAAALPPPHPDEQDMLEFVWERRSNSRLSCQIRLGDSLDEVVVEVPARQA
jgi:ferredoxin, 2Fe-2S